VQTIRSQYKETLIDSIDRSGPSVNRLIKVAGEIDAILCFGILERDADIIYNTQVVVDGEHMLRSIDTQGTIRKRRDRHRTIPENEKRAKIMTPARRR
jgi:hypothetical protein